MARSGATIYVRATILPGGRRVRAGMSIQRQVGVIDVLVRRGLKNEDFCLLLAKECIVLIRERARDEILPGAFGYTSIHVREHNHPLDEDICKAVDNKGNIVIPYDRLRSVRLTRRFSSGTMRREYMILLKYLDSMEKEKAVSAILSPPDTAARGNIGKKFNRAVETEQHALTVESLLKAAIPKDGVFVAEL